jgi:hypothetical protein
MTGANCPQAPTKPGKAGAFSAGDVISLLLAALADFAE